MSRWPRDASHRRVTFPRVFSWDAIGAMTSSLSAPRELRLLPLHARFALCRLPADAPLPPWATGGPLVSITRTADELSVVCLEEVVPPDMYGDRGWMGWRLAGTFDPATVVGVLARLTAPLADAGVSVFVVSTVDTDYLLVKGEHYARAEQALSSVAHIAR